MENNSHAKYFAIVGIILVLVLVYFFSIYSKSSQIGINKFNGSLEKVEGSMISLKGVFVSSLPLPEDMQSQRDFSFLTDASTNFKKMEITFPTFESVRASGKTSQVFEVRDLPRTQSEGSLQDLKNSMSKGDVMVSAEFPVSINKTSNPVANYVFYQILIQPDENI